MTQVLSVRIRHDKLRALKERAEELGCNRSQYVMRLVERDLEEANARRARRFASEDLIGSVRSGLVSGDNATVRAVIQQRLHAKNR